MKKLIQVNGHLLIEPLKQEEFIASDKTTFQEIGVVIDFDPALDPNWDPIPHTGIPSNLYPEIECPIHKGDKVYFDSWLAAKYPTGEHDERGEKRFYWLVKWEDVRMIEHAEVPEQSM